MPLESVNKQKKSTDCKLIEFDHKAERIENVTIYVMPGGEHWFHTPEQMAFLDGWIRRTWLAY